MNKKVFNCETCNYSCEYKYEFDKHSESKKHKRNGKPIEYKCDKCDYIGLNKWNLTMHQATKHYTKESNVNKEFIKDFFGIQKTTLYNKYKPFTMNGQNKNQRFLFYPYFIRKTFGFF